MLRLNLTTQKHLNRFYLFDFLLRLIEILKKIKKNKRMEVKDKSTKAVSIETEYLYNRIITYSLHLNLSLVNVIDNAFIL